MRENTGIFRGKDTIEHKWRYGNLTVHGDTAQIWEDTEQGLVNYLVDPETVGEFTGMTDEDGTRIFEGDIVRTYDPDDSPAVVKYDIGETMFAVVIDNIFYGLGEHFYSNDLIIIGNIHDNPELFEEGSEENERQE